MSSPATSDRVTVGLRLTREIGLCVYVRVPGDVEVYKAVKWWNALPALVSEIRWLRRAIKAGEIVR